MSFIFTVKIKISERCSKVCEVELFICSKRNGVTISIWAIFKWHSSAFLTSRSCDVTSICETMSHMTVYQHLAFVMPRSRSLVVHCIPSAFMSCKNDTCYVDIKCFTSKWPKRLQYYYYMYMYYPDHWIQSLLCSLQCTFSTPKGACM